MTVNLPLTQSRMVVYSLFIAYVPHWFTSPLWLNLIVGAIFVIHGLGFFQPGFHQNRFLRIILLITGCLGLLANIGGLSQGNFFIQMFVLFLFLKALELRSLRDCRVVAVGILYLILTALLLEQELWLLIWLLIAILFELLLLLKLASPEATLSEMGKISSKAIVIALPVALVLFFFFPRLGSPLWQVPSLSTKATGFTDELQLGQFSELFLDESTAMRISGSRSNIHKLYWRGAVLSQYDGKRWTSPWFPPQFYAPLPTVKTQDAEFEIMLEPTGRKWIFYTDAATAATPQLYFNADSGLIRPNFSEINQRFRYLLTTGKEPYKPMHPAMRKRNLFLPPANNPRLQKLGKDLRQRHPDNIQKVIADIGKTIREKSFWYRLDPRHPENPRRQLDTFWFETREGYCEHYASAVTLILRAADIPARIVVGYHGGEWNSIGAYLNVKQANAHAWLEYWQDDKGWKRLDPTTFIPPSRIDSNILAQRQYQDAALTGHAGSGLWNWWYRSSEFLESTQYFWEKWLLFYDKDAQSGLLSSLGLEERDTMAMLRLFIGIVLFFLMIAALLYLLYNRRQTSRLAREIVKWQKFLTRKHISVYPAQSFREQCRRLQSRFPQHSPFIQRQYAKYESLRLKNSRPLTASQEKQLVKLLRDIRRLVPRP